MAPAKVTALALSGSIAISLAACSALEIDDDGAFGDPSSAGADEVLAEVPGQRNAVIIVHGCAAPPASDADDLVLTDALRDAFIAHGYGEEDVIKYLNAGPPCDSTLTQSDELAQLILDVSNGRGQKVDLVAHSMGSLTARLASARYPTRVDDLISIAGANHGTSIGVAGDAQLVFGEPAYEGAKEMFPPYACEGQTVDAADVQFALNGCLTPLGRTVWRDETPGAIDYLTIRNLLDEIIQPVASTCLDQRSMNDCSDLALNRSVVVPAGPCPDGSPCLAHQTVLSDPGVVEMVYDFASAAD